MSGCAAGTASRRAIYPPARSASRRCSMRWRRCCRQILSRFPQARSVAVDQDPVLLAMGQGALSDLGGRLRWVDANLRESSWRERIGVESVDVALSTTALHWLPPGQLVPLYTELGMLIRPEGLFLNGDHMAYAPSMEPFA